MAKVKLPDGAVVEAAQGTTAEQLAQKIGPRLAEAAVAAKINGQLADLSTPINGDAEIQIVTSKDAEGLEKYFS